jgi:hypothetical protein
MQNTNEFTNAKLRLLNLLLFQSLCVLVLQTTRYNRAIEGSGVTNSAQQGTW